jgi:hypothetical protein
MLPTHFKSWKGSDSSEPRSIVAIAIPHGPLRWKSAAAT